MIRPKPGILADSNERRGRFVVFEGLDGAGSTTQMMKFADALRESGQNVETTKEPTSGPIGSVIRQAIDGRLLLDPRTLAKLFAADRSDHILNPVNGILTHLQSGAWVLCDRYMLSSLSYQSVAGIAPDHLMSINSDILTPDYTVFVDTTIANCIKRIGERSKNVELYHDENFLIKVLDVYRQVMGRVELTGELVVVDGNEKPDDVFSSLTKKIRQTAAWTL